jgi:hypothetical protein
MRPSKTLMLALGGAALVAAACVDNTGVSSCFEANVDRYAFHLPGDTGFTFRWPNDRMPVRVYAEPVGDLRANVDAALAAWTGALRCGELRAERVSDSTAADVIVRNPPQMPLLRARAVHLAADSVNACRGRTDGTVDSSGTRLGGPLRAYVWPNSADAQAVAACYRFVTAHEIGHTLGLLSHSPDTLDLMTTVPRRFVLTAKDRYTIQVLYHTAPRIAPAPR